MLVLAIETSCDETSAAVVENGHLALSNIVLSQIDLHGPYGGIVPEIASRRHVQTITEVTDRSLREAGVEHEQIDLVAATHGPGLAGSLLVGVNFAQGLAIALNVPFVPVNHLEGHLYSVWLSPDEGESRRPNFPLLALIVSGGHTQLVLMRGHGQYEVLGRTRDDAAGEAFDKVARLLGLPYPGGPAIEAAAVGARSPVMVPRAWIPGSYDFSFSGVKTAVLHITRPSNKCGGGSSTAPGGEAELEPCVVQDIAAGFQESVVDVLTTKMVRAAREFQPSSVAVVGGVAANQALKRSMEEAFPENLFVAAKEFSTDNAAMIAAATFFLRRERRRDVDIVPNLRLPDTSVKGALPPSAP